MRSMSLTGHLATNFSLGPDVSFRDEAEVGRAAEFAAPSANDAVDGAPSAASMCQRVASLKRTTMRGAVHERG
jgi:hypothetical protein